MGSNYQFINFDAHVRLDYIAQQLFVFDQEGWEILSHSSTTYGMTILMRRPAPPAAPTNQRKEE